MNARRWPWIVAFVLLMFAAATMMMFRSHAPTPEESRPDDRPAAFRFEDVTAASGIDFVHRDGSSGRRFIVESMSAGLATFDFDGDGLIDLYFPNGAALPGATYPRPPRHRLYKNLGNWQFRDVTESSGLGTTAYGLGVAVGDYDNDGHPDLYLNNFGPNILYRNNGNGTFSDVTAQARVARGQLVGAGACFLDIDADGKLDLYVGNYIRLDLEKHVPFTAGGFPSYPSPKSYPPVPDTLYHNNGDGTFSDISLESGIAAHAGRSMGMIAADADQDGDTDLFVLNDVQENFFFRNDGKGHFEETALLGGMAVNGMGETLANMGVDAADYDRDGRLDFFSTNYQNQWPLLLHNLGHGMFEDATRTTNAGAGGFNTVNWGCGWADFDNDGHPDLFVGNGHTEDNIESRETASCYRCRNTVLRNLGGKFEDVSVSCGTAHLPLHAARGVALDDLDNDGDIDVAILNSREAPTLLRNLYGEQGGDNRWLQITLRGTTSNRDGVGAQVRVVAGQRSWVDEVHSGRGYQGHFGARLSFGMGAEDQASSIEVRWLGGGVEVWRNVPLNQHLTLIEGSGSRLKP